MMRFEPSARDESREGEMENGSYLGLRYRQRSERERWKRGINVIAERVLALTCISDFQVEIGLPGMGI